MTSALGAMVCVKWVSPWASSVFPVGFPWLPGARLPQSPVFLATPRQLPLDAALASGAPGARGAHRAGGAAVPGPADVGLLPAGHLAAGLMSGGKGRAGSEGLRV